MNLREQLEQITVSGHSRSMYALSLKELALRAGLTGVAFRKEPLVSGLERYLSQSSNIKKIWDGLSEYERACLADYVINKGYLYKNAVEILAQEYGIEPVLAIYGYGFVNIDEKSKMALFFLNGQMPECIMEQLSGYIQVKELAYSKVEDVEEAEDEESGVEMGLRQDLVGIVKLVDSGKLKITKANEAPTKATVKKINEQLINKEYQIGSISIDFITRGDQTTKIYGLYKMFVAAGVIVLEESTMKLGAEAHTFLALPFVEQIRMLFDAYCKTSRIDEIERIREEKFKAQYKGSLEKVRSIVLQYLSKAPIGEWINVGDLLDQLYIHSRTFLKDQTFTIYQYSMYDRYYYAYEGNWGRLESRWIDVMLLEYLAPLGIVDVAIGEIWDEDEYTGEEYNHLEAMYFKITKLGAYILGLTDCYEIESGQIENALWVNDALEVVVEESMKKYSHEMFFEKFCEKQMREGQSVYKLDFSAMVKLFDQKISVKSVLDYINQESTQEVPPVVAQAFKRWKKDRNKVRIRTVTIIESDDPYIIEELEETMGEGRYVKGTLKHVLEIEKGSEVKVKREIEKKNYFCNVEKNK